MRGQQRLDGFDPESKIKKKKVKTPKLANATTSVTGFEGQMSLDSFNKMEYDITQAFKRIEEKLIDDMMKHLDADELTSFDHFKVEQLKRLEQYRLHNQKEYTPIFEELNEKMKVLISGKFYAGLEAEEQKIMKAIANGYTPDKIYDVKDVQQVYNLNKRKLDALLNATMNDMKKAEYAVLRKAEDSYRKIIFDAEAAFNTGSFTRKEAVDMATKDFLNSGIQCIEYKNGSRHSISSYSKMAINTADTKAYVMAEGAVRENHGCHLVIVNKRGDEACAKCAKFLGKILVDDVYSGGTKDDVRRTGFTRLSEAIKEGYLHPNCKDIHTTYFPGITPLPDSLTKEEKKKIEQREKEQSHDNYVNRQAEKYERLAKHSKDSENKKKYKAKQKQWQGQKE